MRRLHVFACAASASFAWADEGVLGTKADLLPTGHSAAGTSNLMPLFQMVLAVGVVMLLLKFWLPKAVAKLGKGLRGNLNGGLKVEEAASFAGGTLNVVTVRDRTLLLCVGTGGVTFLADLTRAPAKPEAPTFQELVESAGHQRNRPATGTLVHSQSEAGSALNPEPEASLVQSAEALEPEDILAALNRAKLLTA